MFQSDNVKGLIHFFFFCQASESARRSSGAAAGPSVSTSMLCPDVTARQNVRQRRHRQRQITRMLLIVSSFTIATSLPEIGLLLLRKLSRSGWIEITEVQLDGPEIVTNTLFVLGFSLNFVLFTISARMYRKHLSSLFTFCMTSRGSNGGGGIQENAEIAVDLQEMQQNEENDSSPGTCVSPNMEQDANSSENSNENSPNLTSAKKFTFDHISS